MRKGADCMSSPLTSNPRRRREGAGGASFSTRLVLESNAELEPLIVVHPTRIQLHRLRARRQRGVAKHLLLRHRRRVEEIRYIERHLHVVGEFITERGIHVAAVLLPDRTT